MWQRPLLLINKLMAPVYGVGRLLIFSYLFFWGDKPLVWKSKAVNASFFVKGFGLKQINFGSCNSNQICMTVLLVLYKINTNLIYGKNK